MGEFQRSGKLQENDVGWLAEFLGIRSANRTDLAQQTGLKFTLDWTSERPYADAI